MLWFTKIHYFVRGTDQENGSSIFGFPAKRQIDATTDDKTDAYPSWLSDRELATGQQLYPPQDPRTGGCRSCSDARLGERLEGRPSTGRSRPQQRASENLVFSASDERTASRGGAAEIVARV